MPNAPSILTSPAVKTRKYQVGGITTWTDGNPNYQIPLPKEWIYRRLMLNLAMQPTIAKASNTAAKVKRGDGLAIIKNLAINVGSGNPIFSLTGDELNWINNLLFWDAPPRSANTTNLTDTNTDNPTLRYRLLLPWMMPKVVKQDLLYSLDAPTYVGQQFTLDISTGTYTDINEDASAWTSAPAISLEADVAITPLVRNDSGQRLRYLNTKLSKRSVSISGAASRFAIDLPTEMNLRGILLNVQNSSGVDSHLLTNASIEGFGNVFYSRTGNQMRDDTDSLKTSFTSMASSKSSINGWYWLDMLSSVGGFGYVRESLPLMSYNSAGQAVQLSELKLYVDVSAQSTVNAICFYTDLE